MTYGQQMQDIFDASGYDEWIVDYDGAVLTSPNGHRVEPDGVSPDGERSPLLDLGMI